MIIIETEIQVANILGTRLLNKKKTDLEIVEIIKKITAEYFTIKVEDMLQVSRKREFCEPRQILQYFSKNLTELTLREIGEMTGGKNHATVLHAHKTISNLIETNIKIRKWVKEIGIKINESLNI